jgi:predicted amidohydrolase YtcJ
LTLAEAFSAYTAGAAYAANAEHRLGLLAPGFLADLIVLEQDPFACPPDDLLTMQSSSTMVGGKWVWQSEIP